MVGGAPAGCIGSGEIAVVGSFVEDLAEGEVEEVESVAKFGEDRRG
jgi:hypothetical protein